MREARRRLLRYAGNDTKKLRDSVRRQRRNQRLDLRLPPLRRRRDQPITLFHGESVAHQPHAPRRDIRLGEHRRNIRLPQPVGGGVDRKARIAEPQRGRNIQMPRLKASASAVEISALMTAMRTDSSVAVSQAGLSISA